MIQIDDRESDSFKSICSIFFDKCEIKRLEVGDIVVNDQVCFEHKQPEDFLSSIYDGRLFKQIEQMKANYQYNYIIVSGSMTDIISIPNINYNSVMAAIASCFVRRCSVIFCDSPENLCVIVVNLSEKFIDGKDRSITEIKLPIKDDPLRLVCSLPRISQKKAQALLDRFGSPQAIFNASVDELMEVDGIGEKIASNILKVLNNRYNESLKLLKF